MCLGSWWHHTSHTHWSSSDFIHGFTPGRFHQTPHLEDDNPGVGDVVKIDGSFVWVPVPGVTPGVVPIPVDAQPCDADAAVDQRLGAQAQRLSVQGVVFVQAARLPAFSSSGDVGAGHDAVVDGQRADEGPLVVLVGDVVGPRQADASGAEEKRN